MRNLLLTILILTCWNGVIFQNPYAIKLDIIEFHLTLMEQTNNISLYKENIRKIRDEIAIVKDREFAEALGVLRKELDRLAEEEMLKIAKERKRTEEVLRNCLKDLRDKFAPIGAGVQMGSEVVK